jgi:hypothetical protein
MPILRRKGVSSRRAKPDKSLPNSEIRPRVELVGQSDPFQQLAHIAAQLRLGRSGDSQRQRHVVEGRKMRNQAEILEYDADPAPQGRKLAPRQAGQILAEQRNQAARRALGHIDQAQQGGLAGARRAGEEMERARLEAQGDVAQHLRPPAVSHADILEPHHRRQG